MTTATTAATTYTGTVNTTSSGATYITGTSSGLDTQSLINAAVAQKTQKATDIDDKVATNTSKIAAYQNLQTLTTAVQTALSKLTLVTSSTQSANDFDQRTVATSTASGGSASSYFGATVTADAQIGNYSINVVQTAQEMRVQGSSATSTSAGLGYTGSFTLGNSGGGSAPINVTANMSLSGIATAINNASDTSGVTASILQTSNGHYSLVLAGQATATTINASATSGDDVLQNLGITQSDGTFANISQPPQQAELTIDNTPVYSDTNNFDNVLTGVSITAYNPSSTAMTMNVQDNYSGVETDVTSFVTAYNALKDAIGSQENLASDGTVGSSSVLFGDSLVDSINTQLGALLGQSYGGGTAIKSLADIGVTLDVNNDLQVDSSKLETSLLDNFDQVRGMFQTTVNSSSTNIRLYSNTSNVTSANLAFNVTADSNGNPTGVTVNGDPSLFTLSGGTISGAAGSIYQGMSFLYIGGADNFTVNFTAGLADTMSRIADTFSDPNTGQLQSIIASTTATDTTLSAQSAQIKADAETYREQQVTKYANMETALQSAKLLQQQLTALTEGANNANN